jgi:hypothetical protein
VAAEFVPESVFWVFPAFAVAVAVDSPRMGWRMPQLVDSRNSKTPAAVTQPRVSRAWYRILFKRRR